MCGCERRVRPGSLRDAHMPRRSFFVVFLVFLGGLFIIILHKSMDTEIAVLLTCKYPTITTTKRQ